MIDRLFTPSAYVASIEQITPEVLKARGYTAVITDLDNTLIEWNRAYATEEVTAWIRSLEQAGFDVLVISNNNEERVRTFSEPLGLRYVARANKPLQGGYKRAFAQLHQPKEKIVAIGDQLMTDILGGNRAGIDTILVLPVVQTDAKATKFNRFVESKIMKRLEARGLRVQKEGIIWNN